MSDVLEEGGGGERPRRSSGRAAGEGGGKVSGFDRAVREEPEGVGGGGSSVEWASRAPVDGGEDDERVACAEVEPEQAVRGAEVRDATVKRDVTVVVGERRAPWTAEEDGDGFGSGLGCLPQIACGCFELSAEARAEARVGEEVGSRGRGARAGCTARATARSVGLRRVYGRWSGLRSVAGATRSVGVRVG